MILGEVDPPLAEHLAHRALAALDAVGDAHTAIPAPGEPETPLVADQPLDLVNAVEMVQRVLRHAADPSVDPREHGLHVRPHAQQVDDLLPDAFYELVVARLVDQMLVSRAPHEPA